MRCEIDMNGFTSIFQQLLNLDEFRFLIEVLRDPARFLAYFVGALQTIHKDVGEAALVALYAPQPQPPPIEQSLAGLVNENNVAMLLPGT